MESIPALTPKPGSEVDTELEEEIQGGMAGPSSLSAQHQRRRFDNGNPLNDSTI